MERYEDFCQRRREELPEASPLLDTARQLDWTLGHGTQSSVRFRGRPILPPLLGTEQKAEMRELLATALEKSTGKAGRSTQGDRAFTTSTSDIQQQAEDFSRLPSASDDSRVDSSIERVRGEEGRGRDLLPHHSAASSLELSRTLQASSLVHESNRRPPWPARGGGEEGSVAGRPDDEMVSPCRLGRDDDCLSGDATAACGESAVEGDDGSGGGGGEGGCDGGGDGWHPAELSGGVYEEMAARLRAQSEVVTELEVHDRRGDGGGDSGGSGVNGSCGGGGSISGGGGIIGSCDGGGVSGGSSVNVSCGGSVSGGIIINCVSGGVSCGSGVIASCGGDDSGFSCGIVIGSCGGDRGVVGVGGGGATVATGRNAIDARGGADGIGDSGGDSGGDIDLGSHSRDVGGYSRDAGGGGCGLAPASASAVLFAEGDREPATGSGGEGAGAGEWSQVARIMEAQARMLVEKTSSLGRGGKGGGSGGEGRWGGIFALVGDLGEGVFSGFEGTGQSRAGEGRRREFEGGTGGIAGADAEGSEACGSLPTVGAIRDGTRPGFEGTSGRGEGPYGFEARGARSGAGDRGGREDATPPGASRGERRTRSEAFGAFVGDCGGGATFAEDLGVPAGRPSLPAALPRRAWLSERSFERSPRAHDAVPAWDGDRQRWDFDRQTLDIDRRHRDVEASGAWSDGENGTPCARVIALNRSYDVATPSPALLASLRADGGGDGATGVGAEATYGGYWRAMRNGSRVEGERLAALARGYLTRRLFLTDKVQQLRQTVKDTRDLLCSLSLATPPRRARSTQDSALHERALAQLKAAVYDIHDIFFATTTSEKVDMMRSDREARRDRELRRLERSTDAPPQGRPVLSAATRKSLERKFRQIETEQNRAVPRTRGPSVGASSHSRVFRPNQSINTLPPPATLGTNKLRRAAIAKCKESAILASAAASPHAAALCTGARVRKIGGVARRAGSLGNKKRPSLAM